MFGCPSSAHMPRAFGDHFVYYANPASGPPVASDTYRSDAYKRTLAIQAMEIIHQRIQLPLTVNAIAAELDISWSTLAHQFPLVVGETVWQYVKRVRLERACFNLLMTQEGILKIALACGYQSQASFTRAFKQQFHITPSTFRRTRRLPDLQPLDDRQDPPGLQTTIGPVLVESLPPIRVAFIRVLTDAQAPWQTLWTPLLRWSLLQGWIDNGTR